MKIKHNNKEYDAVSFIMKKENAIAILKGEKNVEIRNFSDFYCNMLLDKEIVNKNLKNKDDYECPMKEVNFIHFHDYNNSFYLDCAVGGQGIGRLDKETVKMLNEDYNFHDFDEDVEKYDNFSEEDIPPFFYFEVKALNTNIIINN